MIYIGTCSWSEKTLVQSGEFYRKEIKTAEERLKYYAERFNTVEVDSSYYAIPATNTTWLWSHRTPDNFIFHIKAYGALTGHAIDPKTLPSDMQSMISYRDKAKRFIYVKEPSILKTIGQRFKETLYPLARSRKLGVLVFQFPPWFQYKTSNLDYILGCKDLVKDLPMAVEFRHGSWLTPERSDHILNFLRKHQISYISADEPQYGNLATVPFLPRVTSDTAYFRFHGRNKENWLKKGIETSLRYAYQYSDTELKEFRNSILKLKEQAKKTFVMFNNCHLGFAIKNADRMRELLKKDAQKDKGN